MHFQPHYKERGKRIRRQDLRPYVDHRTADAIRRDAIRWNCSESWVMATALAAFYGIDIIEPAEIRKKKKRRAA